MRVRSGMAWSIGTTVLFMLGAPISPAAAQAAGFVSRPVPRDTPDTVNVERPSEVPRLHHTHLRSTDPDAAIDWYVDVWPQGERGEVAGYPAFVADVPVLFSTAEEPPEGAWDFDRHRAFPQSAFWHIGAFANTTARFEALEARGHTVLRLARNADDTVGVVRSGLSGETERAGGFGYLVGPDGALVEITGSPRTEPRFAHVHLFGERPRCAANWYADLLGFQLPPARDPDTGNPAPRERYSPCEGERAEPTWPSLDPAGTVRGPTATIRHGSGSISIYPRQCLGDQCEVDEPLVPSRGQVLDHVAFEVDDLDAWIAWLEQEGATFLTGRSRFGGLGGDGWRAIVEGPDGLSIELVQPRRARVIERLMSERWMHDGQQPDFVAFEDTRIDYHLTYLSRGGRPGGLDSYGLDTRFGDAFLSMRSPHNTFNAVRAPMPDVEYRAQRSFRSPQEARARDLTRWRTEALKLPAGPFWEVPVALPEGDVRPGVEWADTVDHVDAPGLWLEETWGGVWRYRAVADTTLDGRTYPIVEVDADVRYGGLLSPELSLGGYGRPWPRVRREAEGRLSGRMILDSELGLRLSGSDTTRLEGTVTLIEPDGKELTSPAVYERTQRWALTDSLQWAADLAARREAAADRRTGMLILARDSIEQRLRAGDTALADSLLDIYASASTMEKRSEVLGLLRRNDRSQDWAAEVEPIHLAAGDSAYAINRLLGTDASSGFLRFDASSFDPERAERIVAWLERPDDLLRLGIHARDVRQRVVEAFGRWVVADGPTPCDSGGCRRLADLALAAADPDVRAMGVVTDFLLDPADGWGALRELRAVDTIATAAVWDIATGLPDEEGRSRVAAVAEDPGDWTRWRDLGIGPRPGLGIQQAVDLFRRRTAWDPVDDIRASRATAESDSARVVLGFALDLLGASAEPVPSEIAATLRDAATSDVAFGNAARLAGEVLRDAPDDPVLSDSVTVAVLEMILDGGEGPPIFEPLERLDYASDPIASAAQGFHGIRNRGFILRSTNLPPGFDAARLEQIAAGRATVQDSATASAWDARDGGVVLTVRPVVREGDLATFGWSWTVYDRRTPDQAPLGYSGGGSFVLVRIGDEWRIVSSGRWIT